MLAGTEIRMNSNLTNNAQNCRGILNSVTFIDLSEKINGNKDVDNANRSKSMEVFIGSKSAKKTYSRKKQVGYAVTLEDATEDGERQCRRANKNWRCANMSLEHSSLCEKHYSRQHRRLMSLEGSSLFGKHYSQKRKLNCSATGVESGAKTTSGERRLPFFPESLMSQIFSRVCNTDEHENMQQYTCNDNEVFSQGEPEVFTQFSELASLKDPKPVARRSVPRSFLECTDVSKEDATTAGSEKENTVNLDLYCRLWSQISPSSLQPFSTKLLPANLTENPQIGKKIGDVSVDAGVSTTPKQSRSSVHDAALHLPSFSRVLAQVLQSKPELEDNTQTPDPEIQKGKPDSVHPTKSSEATITVHDDNPGAPLHKTNLQEQILASLLKPDIEGSETENTINLDSPCPLWSQIYSSSSQPYPTKLLPVRLKKNPQIGKEVGDRVVTVGSGTTPKQSSSSLHDGDGRPRFSQSQQGPQKVIQTPDSGIQKGKSDSVYPGNSSEAAITFQDDIPGAPQHKTNLQEQILASLLKPDSEGSEKENTINLDSPCPLWSQIYSSSSPPCPTRLLPVKLKENPRIGKKVGDNVVTAGVGTTPKQSSSSLHDVDGPPRFSQLLRQVPQPKQGLPKITQPRDPGIHPRKSDCVYPRNSSEPAASVQDNNRGVPLSKANLRDQILASLLEPDFEDFVAEVEKVWDEIQESVSDNSKSQVLENQLEQRAGFLPLSQSRSDWRS